MAGEINLYDSDGVKQRKIAVDDTTKRVEIRDASGNDIMDIEAHASRHASGGEDPLPADAIETSMIKDGAVTTAKIADSAITAVKINDDFFQAGVAVVDSVETWVEFPTSFPTVPYVVATPIEDTGTIRITDRTEGSFAWVAASKGSAIWIALRKA